MGLSQVGLENAGDPIIILSFEEIILGFLKPVDAMPHIPWALLSSPGGMMDGFQYANYFSPPALYSSFEGFHRSPGSLLCYLEVQKN